MKDLRFLSWQFPIDYTDTAYLSLSPVPTLSWSSKLPEFQGHGPECTGSIPSVIVASRCLGISLEADSNSLSDLWPKSEFQHPPTLTMPSLDIHWESLDSPLLV